MQRKHRGNPFILIITLILMAIGIIVMFTLSPVRAHFLNSQGSNYSDYYFFLRQIIYVVASIIFFIFMYFFPIKKLLKASSWLFLGAVLINLFLLISAKLNLPFAQCTNGACRWIDLKIATFQPAELLKFSIILYLSNIAVKCRQAGGLTKGWFKNTMRGVRTPKEFFIRIIKNPEGIFWIQYVFAVGISILFVMVAQKDFGSSIPIIVEAVAILFVAGVTWPKLIITVAVAGAIGVLLAISSPHRMERISTFLGQGDQANSYHIEQALIAIGTGGFFGVGVGNSIQATGYLPEAINDSVFAIIAETFGFVGVIIVIITFAILLYHLIRTADMSRDHSYSLVAVGIFAWIATHVCVNIAAMSNIIPLTGITLPLLSYGGTSMIFVGGALGLAYQISAYTERKPILDKERKEEPAHEATRSRRW
ncbi:MAG: FtsW/RodA/SpoVE family cell cycle protein [Candidatus Saccharibacteria bacterium]|nr:FtsW/RodA/SpoVE family cell cycle protein [Candidatus Saccharibacteria bacterium]